MASNVHLDLTAIVKKTKRKLETVAHEVTMDLAETAITRTPVDTGFLRGSWFVSVNDIGAFDGSPDKGGQQSVARVSVSIAGTKVGDTIYVLNGANYASYVENGNSRMAPRGFVKSTVNDAPQIAARTAARIAKK